MAAETYSDFVNFIHDEWKDAILDEQISRRWDKIIPTWSGEFEGSTPEVQMHEQVQISRLCRGIIPPAFKETIHEPKTTRAKNTPG